MVVLVIMVLEVVKESVVVLEARVALVTVVVLVLMVLEVVDESAVFLVARVALVTGSNGINGTRGSVGKCSSTSS